MHYKSWARFVLCVLCVIVLVNKEAYATFLGIKQLCDCHFTPSWMGCCQSQICHKPGIHLDGLEPWPFNPESSELNQKTRLTCQKSTTWEWQSPEMRANGKHTLRKSRNKQIFTWIQFIIWFIYRGRKGEQK